MMDKKAPEPEYSRLVIPNDSGYSQMVGGYAEAFARKLGFDEAESRSISQGVSQAVEISLKYCFDREDRSFIDVTFQREGDSLKVSVHQKGLPINPVDIYPDLSCVPVVAGDTDPLRFQCLTTLMDSFEFRNLGPEGTEAILVKKIPSMDLKERLAPEELEPFPQINAENRLELQPVITIRRMKPDEAIKVAQAVYRTYGHSYSYDHVYFPEKLSELNLSGKIVTAVAVDDSGDVVGTVSILKWDQTPNVAELAQGLVIPTHRNYGIFSRLHSFLKEEGRHMGLEGFFALATTRHLFSQKTALKDGSRQCAALLNFFESTLQYKGFEEPLKGRVAVVVHYDELIPRTPKSIYAPSRHADFIQKIYQHLGIPVVIQGDQQNPDSGDYEELRSNLTARPRQKYARINVKSCGPNFMNYLKNTVRDLLFHDFEVINLFLSLYDPKTMDLCPQIEQLGFFFAGVVPGAAMGDDALVLQYLKNVPVDYDEIRIGSSFGKHILDYVRKNDPNWQ